MLFEVNAAGLIAAGAVPGRLVRRIDPARIAVQMGATVPF